MTTLRPAGAAALAGIFDRLLGSVFLATGALVV